MTDLTINIDAGGTFTDGVFARGDRIERAKVPTTEHDLTVCFRDCIEAGAERFDATAPALLSEAEFVRFSTTVGTNTVIEGTGPRLGVLVTEGAAEDCYAPDGEPPVTETLVEPDLVAGIEESVAPDGTVEREPDPDAVTDAVKRLQQDGARLVVIALSNAYANAANERAVKRAIEEAYPSHYLGSIPTIATFEVSARADEYRRLNTAVVNAYIHRPMKATLYEAEDDVRADGHDRPLFIGHSAGGVARVAKTIAINTYNSGPAAGVLGAAALSELYDTDVVTVDMGGTSIDLSAVDGGQPRLDLSPRVDGLPTHVPAIAVRNAGVGGGSIVSVADGELSVGPESAGANPGPACFGRGGTEATVTDADVVRGVVNPDYFLGGDYDISAERAREAVASNVADPLGVDVETAARRVADRAQDTIARELDGVASDTDTVVAYGGAGPVHAAGFGERYGAERVLVTPYSSVFSAFGESTMDVHHTYSEPLVPATREAAADILEELRAEAERDMRAEGVEPAATSYEADVLVETDEGYRRLGVAYPPADGATFADLGGDTCVRLHAVGPAPTPEFETRELGDEDPAAARKGERKVWWADATERSPVYQFEDLAPGNVVAGPAVVEAEDTTVGLTPAATLRMNEYGHAVIEF